MNLKEQTYVCVLAECGNITRAAERLFISQPALSIYISSLEKKSGNPPVRACWEKVCPDLCGRTVCGKGEKNAGPEGRV